jgi:anti-sigma factor RsiW
MTCAAARRLLSQVADGELDGERADEVRAHGAGCAACARALAELEATVGLLRRAGGEPLPDDFGWSLRQALLAAGTPAPRFGDRLRAAVALHPARLAAVAAAFAALLATAATLALVHHGAAAPAAVASYQVPQSKVALVKIDFVAAEPIDGVAFEITLPDGLRFVSSGDELAARTFRFEGKLRAGSNPIPIAVKGPRAGRYKVIAHAIGPALDVTHEVVLEVTT